MDFEATYFKDIAVVQKYLWMLQQFVNISEKIGHFVINFEVIGKGQ